MTTTLFLTVEPPMFGPRPSDFESLVVQMAKELPQQALASVLEDAQEGLIDSVCGRGGRRCGACRLRSRARATGSPRTSPARGNAPAGASCTRRRVRWSWCLGM